MYNLLNQNHMKKIFFLSALLGTAISASAQFAGGTGTASDPYQIETAAQLQAVSDYATSCFILNNDIDLTDVTWTPIASGSTFTGTFDGNGKTVSNLVIENGQNGLGLFSRVNTPGVIKNLIMRDCYITGGSWCGILCSTNGNWEKAGGTFINCDIYDSSIDGGDCTAAFAGAAGGSFEGCRAFNVSVEGSGSNTGGISGDNENGGHYYDCTFYGSVIASSNAGGICAFYNGTCKVDTCFKNCVVYGSVSSSTGTVGGVLGTPNWNSTNAHIANCAVFADCTGQAVGSFGGNALRGQLVNCYATGNVKATGSWSHDSYSDPWNGGLCAVNFNGPIQDCYFSGIISKTSDDVKIAGVCGRNWPGITVKNCYYNSDGASLSMGDGEEPDNYDTHALLPEEMKKLSNFNFSDMSKWQIVEGETTPFLANQTAPLKFTECSSTRIAGTGESDLAFVYLIGSMSESLRNEVTVSNGTWSVNLNNGDVVAGETITAIGFDAGKMPSMVAKMKVTSTTGISAAPAINGQAKVIGIYNAAGQAQRGMQQHQVYILKYADGHTMKVVK